MGYNYFDDSIDMNSDKSAKNSKNISFVKRLGTGICDAVFVRDNFGFYGDGNYLVIIEISNASNPKEISRISLPAAAKDIYVSGDVIYVAAGSAGLRIIDVTSMPKPKKLGEYNSDDIYAESIFINKNHAYLASGAGGLKVINISNPESPAKVGAISTLGHCKSIHILDERAYLAASDGGERAKKKCMHYAGAVRSILGDERRTLGGAAIDTTVLTISAPVPHEDAPDWVVCVVEGVSKIAGLIASDA